MTNMIEIQNKLDIYGKPEALYLNEDFISYSSTIFQEK